MVKVLIWLRDSVALDVLASSRHIGVVAAAAAEFFTPDPTHADRFREARGDRKAVGGD